MARRTAILLGLARGLHVAVASVGSVLADGVALVARVVHVHVALRILGLLVVGGGVVVVRLLRLNCLGLGAVFLA